MDGHDAALIAAGLIGGAGAIVHGILTERLIVRPFQERAATHMPRSTRRLLAMLLHFSAFNWFVGGLALLVAAHAFERQARLVTGMLVGSSYLFAALGNLWATRGRHPGWVLYGAAVLLIVYSLGKADV